MTDILLETEPGLPLRDRRSEHVERKGVGHPDTICDRVMEAISLALCRRYLDELGRVAHHNVDKALLLAGASRPAFGGGEVLVPIRFLLGGRATTHVEGRDLGVTALALDTARQWLAEHLRHLDVERHVKLESVLRSGSAALQGLYQRAVPVANDTSTGVGHAPDTPTEEVVHALGRVLDDPGFLARFPGVGEDTKVMAIRRDRRLDLTLAIAFVDRHVVHTSAYLELRDAVAGHLVEAARAAAGEQLEVGSLRINTLDDPSAGADGLYLTVTGTSADGADSGQVGRGNRVGGLIPFHRPMSMEAAAGKNPTRHVGKIYNVLARQAARRIVEEVEGVEQVDVWLTSAIGRPLDDPWLTSVRLTLGPGTTLPLVEEQVRALLLDEIGHVEGLTQALVRGELPVS